MKPSLMDGLAEPEEEESTGAESGAAFEELRKRFLEGDPEEAQDALSGLMSMCHSEEYGSEQPKAKPVLAIHIGGGHK